MNTELNTDGKERIAGRWQCMVEKAGLCVKTPALPLIGCFNGKKTLYFLEPKLIHIKNEDVGPNGL